MGQTIYADLVFYVGHNIIFVGQLLFVIELFYMNMALIFMLGGRV